MDWIALSIVLALTGQAPATPAAPSEAADAIVARGSVGRAGALPPDIWERSPRARRLVKVAKGDGTYRFAIDAEGIALRDVLDRLEIRKEIDDGFGRPLDTFVTVTGRKGARALFAWGELYAGDGGAGPFLADRLRLYLPHHHASIVGEPFDPERLLDARARRSANLESCGACHDGGGKLARLELPAGVCLVAPDDRFGGRFVEDVTEIRVHQVGLKAPEVKKEERKPDAFVDVPEIVAPDGTRTKLTAAMVAKVPRLGWRDAGIGMGRGYRGVHSSEGADLAGLLSPLIPPGVDPRLTWVLVTAHDGYRSLYSGSEVFRSSPGTSVILVDREDGKALPPGVGRYRVAPMGDFFVDRGVRLAREIRLGVVR